MLKRPRIGTDPSRDCGCTARPLLGRGPSRRRFGLVLVSLASTSLLAWRALGAEPMASGAPGEEHTLFAQAVDSVLPGAGFQSRIALNDSVLKLVEHGVIDPEKFLAIYEDRGGLPPELGQVLQWPSPRPMLLTRENAGYYVNMLWPVGLANYMGSNEHSRLNGEDLFNFASTGGWRLGSEPNGGSYFNKFRVVELSPEQESLVTRIAKSTFRPCCNNSTFFQDCNHGSALLGVLQLGAAQGLIEDELYREALAFNSFWFPDVYVRTALYFKAVENIDWENVDPKAVMGFDYSAVGPWQANVQDPLSRIPGLVPEGQRGINCST